MKIVVDGFKFVTGSFTNPDTGLVIDYDNVVFNGRRKAMSDNHVGMECVQIKIARKLLPDGFKTKQELEMLLDQRVFFDTERQDPKSKIYSASDFELI